MSSQRFSEGPRPYPSDAIRVPEKVITNFKKSVLYSGFALENGAQGSYYEAP